MPEAASSVNPPNETMFGRAAYIFLKFLSRGCGFHQTDNPRVHDLVFDGGSMQVLDENAVKFLDL